MREVMSISPSRKLSNFSQLDDFLHAGGYMEIPENHGRTLQELMLDCQVSYRSEHGLSLEFEFRQCRLTVVYAKKAISDRSLTSAAEDEELRGVTCTNGRILPLTWQSLG